MSMCLYVCEFEYVPYSCLTHEGHETTLSSTCVKASHSRDGCDTGVDRHSNKPQCVTSDLKTPVVDTVV